MKWFTNSRVKYKALPSKKSNLNEGLGNLEKGKNLYLSNQIQAALGHLEHAINLGFDTGTDEIRSNCFQKLNYHSKAIEINPLEFSHYYSRAVSKKAIFDILRQIVDLHNAIEYYKKTALKKIVY